MFLIKNTLTPEGFIEVPITEDMIKNAEPRAKDIGARPNSIRKGAGNLVGILGQMAVEKAIYGTYTSETFDYDLIGYNNVKIEVKSKDRTVTPKLYYEASVADVNKTQDADLYMFTSVLREGGKYTKAYIVGYVPCEVYRDNSIFLPKGSVDPRNKWEVKSSCYNMQYKDIHQFTESEIFRDFGQKIKRKKRRSKP